MLLRTVIAVALLGCSAGTAAVGQPSADEAAPAPGFRYEVAGVASGDRLNVRAQPDAGADRVGTLQPDARDVVVTGAWQEVGGAVWWEVVHPGAARGTGWVNARFLAVQAPETEETDFPLACFGTEPFWSLDIVGGAGRFQALGQEPESFEAGSWSEAQGRRGHFAVRLEGGGAVGFAVAARGPGFCSDGMSDTGFPFHATVVKPDGTVLAGCCKRSGG